MASLSEYINASRARFNMPNKVLRAEVLKFTDEIEYIAVYSEYPDMSSPEFKEKHEGMRKFVTKHTGMELPTWANNIAMRSYTLLPWQIHLRFDK